MARFERTTLCDRRRFIGRLVSAGIGSTALVPFLIRRAVAMGNLKYPTGMQRVQGRVTINGRPAREGDPVASGDVVATGPESLAVFVHEESVYLLRAGSRFELVVEGADRGPDRRVEVLNNLKGRILAVFARRGRKRILTPTAVAGVRGSAAYVEADPEKTYLCLCYGEAALSAIDDGSVHETLKTVHHEHPRYIYGPKRSQRIVPAPMLNHTDPELVMLEGIVGRKPPFDKMTYF